MKNKPSLMLWIVFSALVAIFIIIITSMLMPSLEGGFYRSFFFPTIISFFLLGGAVIVLTLKEKVKGKLKWFLITTGASSVGFLVFVILHNFFYALAELTSHIVVLKYLMEFLHAAFFLVAVFACPLGFLVGAVGSIVLFIRKRKGK